MNVIKVVSKSNEANLLLLVPKTNFSMSITLKKLYSLIIHFKVLLVSLKYLDCLNLYLTYSRFCNFLRIIFFLYYFVYSSRISFLKSTERLESHLKQFIIEILLSKIWKKAISGVKYRFRYHFSSKFLILGILN